MQIWGFLLRLMTFTHLWQASIELLKLPLKKVYTITVCKTTPIPISEIWTNISMNIWATDAHMTSLIYTWAQTTKLWMQSLMRSKKQLMLLPLIEKVFTILANYMANWINLPDLHHLREATYSILLHLCYLTNVNKISHAGLAVPNGFNCNLKLTGT